MNSKLSLGIISLLMVLLVTLAGGLFLVNKKYEQLVQEREHLQETTQRSQFHASRDRQSLVLLTEASIAHLSQCPAEDEDVRPLLEALLGTLRDSRGLGSLTLNKRTARLHAQLGRLQTALDPQQAIDELRASISIYELLLENSLPGESIELEHGRTQVWLGQAQRAFGDTAGAQATLQSSLAAARAYNARASDPAGRAWLAACLRAQAGVCEQLGEAEAAASLAAEAAALGPAEAE